MGSALSCNITNHNYLSLCVSNTNTSILSIPQNTNIDRICMMRPVYHRVGLVKSWTESHFLRSSITEQSGAEQLLVGGIVISVQCSGADWQVKPVV